MEWCMLASLLLNTLAIILVILARRDPDSDIVTFILPFTLVAATALYLAGLVIYEEPQKIREKAVEAGVGKFVANEKGRVTFFFIRPDGSMVEYRREK